MGAEILCLLRRAENSVRHRCNADWNSSRAVPRRLAPIFSPFLKIKGVCGDHGGNMNRGTGLGVEALYVYRLWPRRVHCKDKATHDTSSTQQDRDCHLFTSVVVRNTTAPNVLCRCNAG